MPDEKHANFSTTHWSLVLAASESDSALATSALERLCQRYWHPIYGFLRQRGYEVPEAEDLTQGFFHHILEKEAVRRANRQKGRFRTFLLTALTNFLHNERDRAQAVKRGGGRAIVSLDEEGAEAAYAKEAVSDETPETLFERRWAGVLARQALRALRKEFEQRGRGDFALALEAYLTGEPTASDYEQLGQRFGMEPGAVKVALHRARRRFGELLRSEVAHTVERPDEVETELRHLIGVMAARPDLETSV